MTYINMNSASDRKKKEKLQEIQRRRQKWMAERAEETKATTPTKQINAILPSKQAPRSTMGIPLVGANIHTTSSQMEHYEMTKAFPFHDGSRGLSTSMASLVNASELRIGQALPMSPVSSTDQTMQQKQLLSRYQQEYDTLSTRCQCLESEALQCERDVDQLTTVSTQLQEKQQQLNQASNDVQQQLDALLNRKQAIEQALALTAQHMSQTQDKIKKKVDTLTVTKGTLATLKASKKKTKYVMKTMVANLQQGLLEQKRHFEMMLAQQEKMMVDMSSAQGSFAQYALDSSGSESD